MRRFYLPRDRGQGGFSPPVAQHWRYAFLALTVEYDGGLLIT